jgi:serine/threonine protein kinase
VGISGTDEIFGQYRLLELIGRGGMGEVYRALDTSRERHVALKLLPVELARDASFARRFRREAQLAARLNNPHIVPIHDFGEIDGRLYIDMRLVDGIDLGTAVARGPLAPDRAADIISQVAGALDDAHKAGLVHRDVKPGNVLLSGDDLSGDDPVFAYLTDFGIAVTRSDTGETGTGMLIGSWAYLAPERFTSGDVDHRADIYALGCVLYELLVGDQPFAGDNIESAIAGHLTMPPPRPSAKAAHIPSLFDEVIARSMAKNPDDRYASAGELGAAAREAAKSSVGTDASPTVLLGPMASSAAPTATEPPTQPALRPELHPTIGSTSDRAGATVFGQPAPGAFATNTALGPIPNVGRTDRGGKEFDELRLHPPRMGLIQLRTDFRLNNGPLPHDAPIPFLDNQKVVDDLRHRLRHSAGGAILLTGFNGVGKTTVVRRALAELHAETAAAESDSLPVIELWETVARPMTPDELMMRLIRNLHDTLARGMLLQRLPPSTAHALTTAYHRTSTTLKSTHQNTTEGTLDIGGEAFGIAGPKVGGKRTRTVGQEHAFLPYTLTEAEHDFLRIVHDLSTASVAQAPPRRRIFGRAPKPWRCRIVVVFDELDKLTADPGGLPCLEELLRQLKNILTSSNVHFVFVGGAETFQAARIAHARGGNVWDNVFGYQPYLGCLRPGAAHELLQALLIDGATGRGSKDLADYLEYRSRGLPRLLLNELGQLIRWDPTYGPHIAIDPPAAASIAFFAALHRRLGPRWADAKPLGPLTKQIDNDRRRMATHLVMDWVLARAGASFTTADFLADRAEAGTGPDVLPDDQADDLFRQLAACGVLDSSDPVAPDHTLLGPGQPTEVAYQLARAIVTAANSMNGTPDELGRVGGGRYVLKEELGRGALGRTYRARDTYTSYDVAIKLLDLPELRYDDLARQRFRREVDLASRLDHRLLATMYDSIDDEGQLGLIAEYITGRPLAEILRHGPLSPPAAARMGYALADLLTYLDSEGVFRLDLKPSNIVVRNDGRPVVVELGLARLAHDHQTRLTRTGAIVGTPLYLAPEQLRGEESDIRSDLYTLGLLMHEMLTGHPVRHGNAVSMIIQAATEQVDVSWLPCSPQLKHVLASILESDVNRRCPEPSAVAAHLQYVPELGLAR